MSQQHVSLVVHSAVYLCHDMLLPPACTHRQPHNDILCLSVLRMPVHILAYTEMINQICMSRLLIVLISGC